MTMHLLPAFVTTTNTRKRKSRIRKVCTRKAKIQLAAHQEWVEKMTKGMKSDKKVLDSAFRKEYTNSMMVDRSAFTKSGMVPGVCAKPEEKVYSGEMQLLGIATMHKSNMVPVFKKQDAEDIARMRRG
jgi:hypothetical protein